MFGDLRLFQMARKQMDWAARRQEVLAENVANADTPKYQPHDVAPVEFRKLLGAARVSVQPVVTNPMHVAHVPLAQSMDEQVVKTPYETSPDGNAVILEEQMRKVGETRHAYEVATTLFSKHMRLLRLSLGKGGP